MPTAKHVVVVAGEESGDAHAAAFIKELRAKNSEWRFSGIGGQHMQDAGVELVSDLARYGVAGLTEVVRYFGTIRRAFQAIKDHLQKTNPDVLILVDYPGFNLRLARYAKRVLGLKVIYYISPQIWAWKGKRIHKIKQHVDHMAVIFPFEKNLYQRAGVPVSFVGHPLVTHIPHEYQSEVYRRQLNIPIEKTAIALLPGSRAHEIERHMPVLMKMAHFIQQKDPKVHFIIPIAATIPAEKIKKYFTKENISVSFVNGQALATMAAANIVIVASGTASLECALLGKPMAIIYKASLITYIAAMKLIRVKFLGLCNLLSNKMLVPEFLQYDCNAEELTKYVLTLFEHPTLATHMQTELKKLYDSLSATKADCSFSELITLELA